MTKRGCKPKMLDATSGPCRGMQHDKLTDTVELVSCDHIYNKANFPCAEKYSDVFALYPYLESSIRQFMFFLLDPPYVIKQGGYSCWNCTLSKNYWMVKKNARYGIDNKLPYAFIQYMYINMISYAVKVLEFGGFLLIKSMNLHNEYLTHFLERVLLHKGFKLLEKCHLSLMRALSICPALRYAGGRSVIHAGLPALEESKFAPVLPRIAASPSIHVEGQERCCSGIPRNDGCQHQ